MASLFKKSVFLHSWLGDCLKASSIPKDEEVSGGVVDGLFFDWLLEEVRVPLFDGAVPVDGGVVDEVLEALFDAGVEVLCLFGEVISFPLLSVVGLVLPDVLNKVKMFLHAYPFLLFY